MEGVEKSIEHPRPPPPFKPVLTEIFILKELYLKLNQTCESLKNYRVQRIIHLYNWPNISLRSVVTKVTLMMLIRWHYNTKSNYASVIQVVQIRHQSRAYTPGAKNCSSCM